MKNIPELRFSEFSGEWVEKRLGEVCEIVMGQSPDSKFYNQNKNGLPLIQGANDFEKINNYTTQITKICEKNNIIMSVRAPVGTLTKAKQKSCIGRGVCAIKGNDFIYYVLIKNQRKLKIYSQGTTFEAINSKDLKSLKIHLPPTFEEQQKIASFLSSIDEKIEITTKKIEKLKKYKKGLLQKLLNVKNKEPELRFPEFSREWGEKNFSDLFTTISTKPYQIKSNEILFSGKYPVIDQGKTKIAGYSNENKKALTNKGIIIFGDHTTILKYIDFDFIVGADGVKLLRNKDKNHHLKFLYYALLLNNVKPEGYKRHFSILKQLKIHLPLTIEEQQKIASFLSSIDEKIELNEQKLTKLKEYKKGLLQKMFM